MLEPVYDWRGVTLYHGEALEILGGLEAQSISCCITSPPYWNLRDYKVDQQLGLERTPEEYVDRLVTILREVRRVLRDDGTLWIVIGDSYANDGKWGGMTGGKHIKALHGEPIGRARRLTGLKPKDLVGIPWMLAFALRDDGWYLRSDIIWSKINCCMPESVTDRPTRSHEFIFLLAKNQRYYYDYEAIKEPSVAGHGSGNDFKREARLSFRDKNGARGGKPWKPQGKNSTQDPQHSGRRMTENVATARAEGADHDNPFGDTRSKRDVWTVNTAASPDPHFAVYPEALILPCVLAGCPPAGKRCDCGEIIETPLGEGATDDPTMFTGRAGMNRSRRPNEGTRPITRMAQRDYARQMRQSPHRAEMASAAGEAFAHYVRTDKSGARPLPEELLTAWLECGWLVPAPQECDCPIESAGTILDPFIGSGTTALVAKANGRKCIGIDLNRDYLRIAERRVSQDVMFNEEVAALEETEGMNDQSL